MVKRIKFVTDDMIMYYLRTLHENLATYLYIF